MAAESVRDLITRLIFKVDRSSEVAAERAGTAVKKAAEKSAEGWTNFSARIGLAINGLQQLGGIAKGLFATLITNFANATDEAAKTARAVGVTVGKLQELNFAAQLSGGTTQDVTKILGQLAKAGREASKGTKTFAEAFGDLGVKVTDGQGKLKSTSELLGDVSDRFKIMKDGSEKTALAMKLFGRAGAKMIPFLSEGREGLAKMGADARRLGIVLSDQAAKKAENFNDQLLRAKSAVQGVRNRIAVALLPTLTAMAERFAAFVSDGERVDRILEAIKIGASVLGSVLATLAARQIMGVILGFGRMAISAALGVVALFRLSAAQVTTAISTRLLAGAMRLLGGALKALGILLIVAALQDLFNLATGKKSVIAEALDPETVAGLKETFKEVAAAFKEILKAIAPLLPILAKIIGFLAKIVVVIIKGIVKAIKWVVGAFKSVGKTAGSVVKAISSAWDSLTSGMIAGLETVLGPIRAIKEAFLAVVNFVKKIWKAMVDFIIDLGNQVKDVVIKTINPAAKLFGIDLEKDLKVPEARVKRFAPKTSTEAAGRLSQAAGRGGGATVNQQNKSTTTINVPGAGDPQAVADRVAAKLEASQKETQDTQLRQAMAMLRGQ